MTLEFRSGRCDCRQIEALLPPFVDGAASELDRARVAAHLGRCPSCRQAAEAQGAVRALLRRHCTALSSAVPAGLAGELRAAAARAATAPVLGRRGRLSALAAAAGVVLVVMAGVAWGTARSSVLLAAQLTLDHIKCFIIDGADHAGHFTAAAAEAEMQDHFGWSVPVPVPAAGSDVHLVAVRRCLYGEGIVAHVLYRVQGRPVSLFVIPGRDASAAEMSAFGRHAQVLTRDGATVVVVAPEGLSGVAAALGLEAE
jgi:anti-sigma factor RsiW